MRRDLEVWAVARSNGDVLAVFPICAEHAAWTRSPDFSLAPGTHAFRVKARAWVRRILRRCERNGSGCVECALREGRAPILSDAAPLGTVKVRDLDTEGATA